MLALPNPFAGLSGTPCESFRRRSPLGTANVSILVARVPASSPHTLTSGPHAAGSRQAETPASRSSSSSTSVSSWHSAASPARERHSSPRVRAAAINDAADGVRGDQNKQRRQQRQRQQQQHEQRLPQAATSSSRQSTGVLSALQVRPADAAFEEDVARLLSGATLDTDGDNQSGRSSAEWPIGDNGGSAGYHLSGDSWSWRPDAEQSPPAQLGINNLRDHELTTALEGAASPVEVLDIVSGSLAQLDEALVCLALTQLCRAPGGLPAAAAVLESDQIEKSLQPLIGRVLELRTSFIPAQLALVIRCLAQLQMHSFPVYQQLEEAVLSWAPKDFSPALRTDMLWAFAQVGYRPEASLVAGFASTPPVRPRAGRLAQLPLTSQPRAAAAVTVPSVSVSILSPRVAITQRQAERHLNAAQRESLVAELRPEQVARLLWAFAKLDHQAHHIVTAAARSFTAEACADLSTQALVSAMWACAKMHANGALLLTPCTAELVARLYEQGALRRAGGQSESDPQAVHWRDVATTMWACGRLLHHPGHREIQILSSAAESSLLQMGLPDIVRVCWALGRLGHTDPELMKIAAAQLRSLGHSPKFDADNVPMLLWAFAALNYNPGVEVLDLLAEEALTHADDFKPATISSSLWSLSSLEHSHEQIFAVLGAVAVRKMAGFQPSHLADMCRAYAKVGSAPQDLLDAVASHAAATINNFNIQEMIRMVTALSVLGQQPAELLEAIEGWTDQRLSALAPYNLSMALWSFARLGASPSISLLEVAAASVMRQLHSFTPTQLSRVIWSFVKLEYYPEELLDAVTLTLSSNSSKYDGKAVSNVLWALARRGPVPSTPAMLDSVALELGPRAKKLSAHSLANIVWAYAKLESRPQTRFLTAMAGACRVQLNTFESQGITNMLWGFAVMGHADQSLLAAVEVSVIPRLPNFEAQHLANMLWSFAKLDYKPKRTMLVAVSKVSVHLLPQFTTQELFNLVYAYAKLKFAPHYLLSALVPEIVGRATDFTPQELSNTAWAYARLQHDPYKTRPLLKAVASQVLRRVDTFECQHIATTAWAFAEYDWAPQDALQALYNEAGNRGAEIRPQHIAMLLQAAGHLSFHPGEVTGTLIDMACTKLSSFRDFELANMLRAIGEIGLSKDSLGGAPGRLLAAIDAQPAIVECIMKCRSQSAFIGAFSATITLEAYETALYSRLCDRINKLPEGWFTSPLVMKELAEASELARLEVTNHPEIPNSLRIRLLAARTRKLEGQRALTGSQAEVANALVELGWDVRLLGSAVGDVELLLPIVVAMPRGLVAVEVLQGRGDMTFGHLQPTGQVQMRRRRIEAEGYDVVSVLSSDWRLQFNKKDPSSVCYEMLKNLLKEYT